MRNFIIALTLINMTFLSSKIIAAEDASSAPEEKMKSLMEKKLMESIVNQMHLRGKIDNNQFQIAQVEIKKIIQ